MSNHPALLKASREADQSLLAVLAVNALYAIYLASDESRVSIGLGVAVPALLLPLLAFWRWPGQFLTRILLTLALGAVVCLQASLSHGSYLAHANMFICLSLLLAYEDARLHAALGLLFIGARLLEPGWWVYPGAAAEGVPAMLSDVILLALLSTVLTLYARRQARRSNERFELEFLVNAMGREGPVRLNLDVVLAHSRLGTRLKDAQARMAATLRQVRDVVFSVHSIAGEMTESSADLRQRTEHTDTGLRDTAMSLEQINVIVQESSRAAREARELAVQASEMASSGGRIVGQVVEAMQRIDASSKRITDIIGVIDTIAFQTNILALNAAVEAARAGEQGRGFAVVAAEVRTLAHRSSDAAREIKGLIGDSVSAVEGGTRLAAEAGGAMSHLVDAVQRVGAVFESLTADSSEHAQGIDVVTASVRELDEVTRQNVLVADRSGDIAYELQVQAANLAGVLASFKLGGDEAVAELKLAAQAAVQVIEQQRAARASQAGAGGQAGTGSAAVEFF